MNQCAKTFIKWFDFIFFNYIDDQKPFDEIDGFNGNDAMFEDEGEVLIDQMDQLIDELDDELHVILFKNSFNFTCNFTLNSVNFTVTLNTAEMPFFSSILHVTFCESLR